MCILEMNDTLNDFDSRMEGSNSAAMAYDISAASNWSIAIKASPWQMYAYEVVTNKHLMNMYCQNI